MSAAARPVLRLTAEENELLKGSRGPGAVKAMEILRALGEIGGAADMAPVKSVQVSGISYKNIGEHGLAFLEAWAAMGSRAAVPAYMNPGGADMKMWKELGFPAEFVSKQKRVIEALTRLGVQPSLTCTPYHMGVVPAPGESVAWAESSAVIFANSALGARTNREGGPSAIAAALTGRTPRHSLHTDAGRLPTRVVSVRCPVESTADAGTLGCLIGRILSKDAKGGIPYIKGARPPDGLRRESWLKALGASMAAFGSSAIFHIEGVTPEAVEKGPELEAAAGARSEIVDLSEGLKYMGGHKGEVDMVAIGCPHASAEDLVYIESRLSGRPAKMPMWVFTSRFVRDGAVADGTAARLETQRVKILADTCIVVAPLKDLGIRSVAIDSGKSSCYLPSHQGVAVRFASTEELIEAAAGGSWK